MADDDLKPEDAYKAIVRASERKPQVSAVRDRIQKMATEDKGLEMLARAIKRLLHEER